MDTNLKENSEYFASHVVPEARKMAHANNSEYTIRFTDIANFMWLFRVVDNVYEVGPGKVILYEVDGHLRAKCEDVIKIGKVREW